MGIHWVNFLFLSGDALKYSSAIRYQNSGTVTVDMPTSLLLSKVPMTMKIRHGTD